jgi:hypothetical protein
LDCQHAFDENKLSNFFFFFLFFLAWFCCWCRRGWGGRHYVAVSSDSLTFAVGGVDGTIHVYNWKQHPAPFEIALVPYSRSFIRPRSITFNLIHGSSLMLVGGDLEEAFVYDFMNNREVARLILESQLV